MAGCGVDGGTKHWWTSRNVWDLAMRSICVIIMKNKVGEVVPTPYGTLKARLRHFENHGRFFSKEAMLWNGGLKRILVELTWNCMNGSVCLAGGEAGGREKHQCVHPGGSRQNRTHWSDIWKGRQWRRWWFGFGWQQWEGEKWPMQYVCGKDKEKSK